MTPSGSLSLLSGRVKAVTVCLPVLRSSCLVRPSIRCYSHQEIASLDSYMAVTTRAQERSQKVCWRTLTSVFVSPSACHLSRLHTRRRLDECHASTSSTVVQGRRRSKRKGRYVVHPLRRNECGHAYDPTSSTRTPLLLHHRSRIPAAPRSPTQTWRKLHF